MRLRLAAPCYNRNACATERDPLAMMSSSAESCSDASRPKLT
jgi:hypothetical protein